MVNPIRRVRRTTPALGYGAICALTILAGFLGSTVGASVALGSGGSLSATATTHLRWHALTPPSSPSARDRVNVVYDPADHYTVLYGGYDPYAYPSLFSDTWMFLKGNWTQLTPAHHPSAPSGLVLAYDPALKGVLAFGGEAPYGSAYYNDTWLFQAGNWTQLSPSQSPPPRSQYAMTYDVADSEMVLFGGYSPYGSLLADTWVFNGTTWSQVHSHKTPMGRQLAAMVYDPSSNQALLVGGTNASYGAPQGTWGFSAGQWKLLHKSGFTPTRIFLDVTNLPSGTPIMFGGLVSGGSVAFNDSYEFVNGAWHHIRTAHPPPTRFGGGFTYDKIDRCLLEFGGRDAAGTFYSDTWALR